MKLYVQRSGDKILLITESRSRDLLLTPLNATRLADRLLEAYNSIQIVEPELVKGEVWDIHVRSFDKMVAIRIAPPPNISYAKIVVPLPIEAAKWLAKKLYENAQWCGWGMRLMVY